VRADLVASDPGLGRPIVGADRCLPRPTRRADRQGATAPGSTSATATPSSNGRDPVEAFAHHAGALAMRVPRGPFGVARHGHAGRGDQGLVDRTAAGAEHDCDQVSGAVSPTRSIGGGDAVNRGICKVGDRRSDRIRVGQCVAGFERDSTEGAAEIAASSGSRLVDIRGAARQRSPLACRAGQLTATHDVVVTRIALRPPMVSPNAPDPDSSVLPRSGATMHRLNRTEGGVATCRDTRFLARFQWIGLRKYPQIPR
jgi:hypothetical protein